MLTRGDVSKGTFDLIRVIHDPCNCVELHSECHRRAHSQENELRCIRYILMMEGAQAVFSWIGLVRGCDITMEALGNLMRKFYGGIEYTMGGYDAH